MIRPDWLPLSHAARQARCEEQTLLLALIAGALRGGDDGAVSWVDPDALAVWAESQRGRGEDQPNAHTEVLQDVPVLRASPEIRKKYVCDPEGVDARQRAV